MVDIIGCVERNVGGGGDMDAVVLAHIGGNAGKPLGEFYLDMPAGSEVGRGAPYWA